MKLIIAAIFGVLAWPIVPHAEKVTFESDVSKWKQVVLLDYVKPHVPFARIRVPQDWEVFESEARMIDGQKVLSTSIDAGVAFFGPKDKCNPNTDVQFKDKGLDVRCSYVKVENLNFGDGHKQNSPLAEAYESPWSYVNDRRDTVTSPYSSYRDPVGKENSILEMKDFPFAAGWAWEMTFLSADSRQTLEQPLTREVIFFSRKDPPLDRILHLRYAEQNWKRRGNVFKKTSEWMNEATFNKILSTVEFVDKAFLKKYKKAKVLFKTEYLED